MLVWLVILCIKELHELQKVHEANEDNSLQNKTLIHWWKSFKSEWNYFVVFLSIRWNQDWRRNFDDWYLILHWLGWWIIGIVLGILFLFKSVIFRWQTFEHVHAITIKITFHCLWTFCCRLFEHDLKLPWKHLSYLSLKLEFGIRKPSPHPFVWIVLQVWRLIYLFHLTVFPKSWSKVDLTYWKV